MVFFSFLNKIKTKKGFTLPEVLLGLTVAGIIFAIVAETMFQQVETYSFIANRKTTIADARHALNNITYELLHISEGDILDISTTNIDFIDNDGVSTSYEIDTYGAGMALYKGGSAVILPSIDSFTIEYQNGVGDVLDPINDSIEDIVRIKFTIVTEPTNNEESITLSTTVIPRSFIGYSNYQ